MDGNAEQVRQVADQMAEAILARLKSEIPTLDKIEERIEEKIAHALTETEVKFNRRLIGAVFANAIPMIIAAFFMGGLWVKFSGVPQLLDGRGHWLRSTEVRVTALEAWAVRQGEYEKPPTMVTPP